MKHETKINRMKKLLEDNCESDDIYSDDGEDEVDKKDTFENQNLYTTNSQDDVFLSD